MNRKFILIGLLLVACFAFTVLQAATGEAQQCDPGPACVENCCGQCDPNPACVENCCPADDPNVLSGNVTLDPNIDLRPPAPTGKRGKSINPQPLTGRQFNSSHKEDNAATAHRQNTGVNKPDIQGIEDRANRRPQSRTSTPLFIPPSGAQPEARVGRARHISCENIRAEIGARMETLKSHLQELPGVLRGNPCNRTVKCMVSELENADIGLLINESNEKIREIQEFIDDHCL